MASHDQNMSPEAPKRRYASPSIAPQGRIEELTRWGQHTTSSKMPNMPAAPTWNPWTAPGGGS